MKNNKLNFPGSLHNHTDFSNFRLRDSINTVEGLIDRAIELGHTTLAITEHETIGSSLRALRYYKEIKKDNPNFKLVLGNEIYLTRNGLASHNLKPEDRYYHFVLLAKDETGHKQLRELSTKAWSHSFTSYGMQRVPTYYQNLYDVIQANPGHLVGTTACLGGVLGTQLMNYQETKDPELLERIKKWVLQINNLFGEGNFFLEMQPSKTSEQIFVNNKIVEISNELNIPYLISTDSHYLSKKDRPIHKAFLTAQQGARETDAFYASTYMMDTKEIYSYMEEHLGEEVLQNAFYNTKKIANMCEDYELEKSLSIPYLPRNPIEPTKELIKKWEKKIDYINEFLNSKYSSDRHLIGAILKKIDTSKELQNEETYKEVSINLKSILESSNKQNVPWSAYLLNVKDYIDLIWSEGDSIVPPGRGCFTEDAQVLLESGKTKSIKDVKIGDNVYTHTGAIQKVEKTFSYPIEEELVTIKTGAGEKFTCTKDHKIYAIKNILCKYKNGRNCVFTCKRNCNLKEKLKPEWISSQDLTINDMIVVPKPTLKEQKLFKIDLKDYVRIKYYKADDKYLYTFKGNNTITTNKKHQRFIDINKEFMYFLGVFIGDGWTRERDHSSEIGIAFHSENAKDQKSLKRIKEYLLSLGLKSKEVLHADKKLVQLMFNNTFLGSFLREECGKDVYHKQIPDWAIFDNSVLMESLLEGLLDSDGHVNNKEIHYDSVSYQLISQIHHLLRFLNISATLIVREKRGNNAKSYKLKAGGRQINSLSFKKFNNTRQFIQRTNNYYLPRIRSIKKEYAKTNVYDIKVEQDNSFIVNGHAVHNSGGGFILLYILGITQMNPLREKTKTYHWRFLNSERASVLDIDFDIESAKRAQIYRAFQKNYGADRVSKVLTLRTEKARSAIQTAFRGLGLDVDDALYVSSLVKSDRGLNRTLAQTFYGDEEEGLKPNKEFVRLMTEQYPEVWRVAQGIEGLINGVGSHAGGVIFTNEPFWETAALMKTSSGDVVTQFDLHDAESVGLIKIDLLSVDAADRIRITLDLLVKYGYIEEKPTLRETYESVIGVYNLERDNEEMWRMAWNHEVQSLFQMEQPSGIQGIELVKPKSVDELAVLNSVIRLMASERGAEQPLNKFARFKKNPKFWEQEMIRHGLTQEEQDLLKPILSISYGLCIAQEQFMELVQLPELGGHSLLWADRLRKAVARKNPQEYEQLTEEFFETIKEKDLSYCLADYVWNVLIAMNRGYGFNSSHTLLYSLIALQELNLAYRFPIVFWNTACLIVDSGGIETEENDQLELEEEEIYYTNSPELFVEIDEDEDEEEAVKEKTQTRTRSTNYGKIASAIGRYQGQGITILPPDINESDFTFLPDVKNNAIKYGLSGITRVGEKLILEIMEKRPYTSLQDFLKKVKVNKLQAVNLIKAGAFDQFDDRVEIMKAYINSICGKKKTLNLRNMMMMIKFNMLPDELEFEIKVYNFNKYLRKFKEDSYFKLDNNSLRFYEENFDMDNLILVEDSDFLFKIDQKIWDNYYQSYMDTVRTYVKKHQEELLKTANDKLFNEMWEKYAEGTIGKWEMDSISHYSKEHELQWVDNISYNLTNFNEIPEEPEIDYTFYIEGKPVHMFKLYRIAGTVLDRDKIKGMVTLLTTDGVAQVRIFGPVFSYYDRQVSERDPVTGRKKVLEKSWFTRGNKIIVNGMRRGEFFIAKKYKNTPYKLVEKIDEIYEDGRISTSIARVGDEK